MPHAMRLAAAAAADPHRRPLLSPCPGPPLTLPHALPPRPPASSSGSGSMERKRKLEVYEAPPVPAQPNGQGIGWQQTAAPPAVDGSVNPYTGRQYSARYHQILATRQGAVVGGLGGWRGLERGGRVSGGEG